MLSPDLILAIMSCGGIGVAFAGYGLWSLSQGWASKGWPTAKGRVTKTQIAEIHGRGSSWYSAGLQYSYDVNGQSYTAKRQSFAGATGAPWRSAPRAVLDRYPQGAECKVYYDPARPSRACLEPGIRWNLCFDVVVGAGFIALTVLMLLRWQLVAG